jgi:hypothetical protein
MDTQSRSAAILATGAGPDGAGVADGFGGFVGLGVFVGAGVGDGVGLGVALGAAVGVAVGGAVGVAVAGAAVGDGVGVGAGVGVATGLGVATGAGSGLVAIVDDGAAEPWLAEASGVPVAAATPPEPAGWVARPALHGSDADGDGDGDGPCDAMSIGVTRSRTPIAAIANTKATRARAPDERPAGS